MKLFIVVFLISSCIFSISAQNSTKCDPQDSLFGNKCYRFVDRLMNFTSAIDYCRGIGYSLTSIHSMDENNFLTQQSKNVFDKTHHNFHIGLYSPSKNKNNWVFVDGSAYDFNNWHSGEPTGTHWYVASRVADGKWITVSNSASIPFVCSAASNNTSPANTTVVPMTTTSSGTCAGQTCDNYAPGCSSNPNCVCYQTQTGAGFCGVSTDCDDMGDCSNCPAEYGVCIQSDCCGESKCKPLSAGDACKDPPRSRSSIFNLFRSTLSKRQSCKEDKDCSSGKSCKKFSSGKLCA